MIEICFTGDSIAASVELGTRQPRGIGDYMARQIKGCKVRNIAWPGDGIDEQTIRWNQISADQKLRFDFVISMNGNNDLQTTIENDYPAFWAMVKSQIKPSCKIISLKLTPYGGAAGAAERLGKNNYVTGISTPSMAVYADVFVIDHTTYMDDGNNNLKSPYYLNEGDRIHLSPSGREVVADSVVQKMKLMGWIK